MMLSVTKRHEQWEEAKRSKLYWSDPFQGYLPIWHELQVGYFGGLGHTPASVTWSPEA